MRVHSSQPRPPLPISGTAFSPKTQLAPQAALPKGSWHAVYLKGCIWGGWLSLPESHLILRNRTLRFLIFSPLMAASTLTVSDFFTAASA